MFRNRFRSNLHVLFVQYETWPLLCKAMNLGTLSITAPSVRPCLQPQTGPSFDLPTMGSRPPVPNSHRVYDLETDGITITAHIPPKRSGANAREVANWTRNSGKSKDDPFVIDDDDEVQDIHRNSSIRLTNHNMAVSTTRALL